jgi:arylsulfatase A-like enzyme
VGATALVSTALFASDNLRLKLEGSSSNVESIDTLAVMLGLITLMCIGAAMVAALIPLIEKALARLYPQTALIKLFVHSSNLLIPSLGVAYCIRQKLAPNTGLSMGVAILLGSIILSLGLAQLPIIRHLTGGWHQWSNRWLSWTALLQLSCYLAISIQLKPILSTQPIFASFIQFMMLSGLIGLCAQALHNYARRTDFYGLSFIFALQLGCVVGLLNHPQQKFTQLVSVEYTSPTASRALELLRWTYDRDGDGFSEYYSGGDCNDGDPLVHPHADEIPGNGRDDNCLGGDAPIDDPISFAHVSPIEFSQDTQHASVVLIVVDTLRSDRVLYDGNGRNTTPNLSRWARQSARFLKAFAQAPHTPRSMPSLLTGKYPSRVAWVNSFENYPTPHQSETFLAEEFYDHGYTTASISSHWYFARIPEVLRGFERNRMLVQSYREQTDARETTDTALAELSRLEANDEPFFLMVHYIDPHEPYSLKGKKSVFGARRLIDRYDSEVHFLDKHIGRLLTRLTALQADEELFVVVTSDHGEAFREHGLLFHGRSLYNEEIQVPLLINGPSVPAVDIVNPVGLIDVAPTIRSLTGLPARPSDGISLQAMMSSPNKERGAHLYSEILPYPRYNQHRLAAISADGRWKLIRNLTRHTIELFDLDRDPREKRNRFSKSSAIADSLKLELERFVDGKSSRNDNSRTVEQSRDGTPVRIRQAPESRIHRSNL